MAVGMKIAGTKQQVISKLFVIRDDRKLVFSAIPTAISRNVITPEELFHNWQEFYDYLMESTVMYKIRFEDRGDVVEIFTQLDGSPKYQYIKSALKFYIKVSGLSIVE
ncbi:hypothetical protein [Nostoc sp. 106C]|uniref:hypothetical protein n=1 Tax=Nostoc sp. 106C TaxID=1932667 RepID=UPI000A378BAD|nr:hypothetical protein [Nostoc sp. 106C]OUL23401.1 hypothetical protein BV375_26110 [Nostoc sp. 106C]